MITIKCDRCGLDIDWRTYPAFAYTFHCADPNSDSIKKPDYTRMTLTLYETKGIRNIDLCDSCKKDVYNFIFKMGEEK